MHLYIITGASRGLGAALTDALITSNHKLICISRQTNLELQTKANNLRVSLTQWQQNLTDSIAAAERLRHWFSHHQHDGQSYESVTLINNAGVIPRIAPLSEAISNDLSNALRVGLEAPMLLSAAFLHGTQSWTIPKKIMNISSGLGRRAMASQAGYCAAKAGMDHYTRCLALEEALKPHGAKVCSVAPGVIDTDMQIQLRSADTENFPDQAGFIALKKNGGLATPTSTAQKLLTYLHSVDFGEQAIADIRET